MTFDSSSSLTSSLLFQSDSVKPPLENDEVASFMPSLALGFQLISQAGPLCEEPMMGVCFEVGCTFCQ